MYYSTRGKGIKKEKKEMGRPNMQEKCCVRRSP
jgi:hypothetical protein